MKKQIMLTILFLGTVLISVSACSAATLNVGTGETYLNISSAYNASNNGDTILIKNGTYTGSANRAISIQKNLTITGDSQTGTIIDAQRKDYIVSIESGYTVTISKLTLRNGSTTSNGGAILNKGNLIVTDCTFINNTAGGDGGAIRNQDNGIATVLDSNFINNTASASGGAISNYHTTWIDGLVVSGCNFEGNKALSSVSYCGGGAIYTNNYMTVNYNRFYKNTAPKGNAIFNYVYEWVVNANYNWWGSNNPDFSNLVQGITTNTLSWVVLNLNANPTTINNTQISHITADLNHYTDSSGNIGTLTEYIPEVGVTFAVDANGNLDSLNRIISEGQNAATNFTATKVGLATVSATVDGFTVNQLITILDNAPIVTDESETTDEDTSATGQITATDADGDTLTYTKATNPAHGTATINSATGDYIYTPVANWHGTDSFIATVSDGNGRSATATVTIIVNSLNDVPVAQNDTAVTKEGKSINISVLGNDSDADGDLLTVTNVTQPNHGTVTINADGKLTYTPNSNWYGPDSFIYTVSDGNGGTTTATVNITVNHTISDLYIKTTTSSQNPTVGEIFTLTYKLGNYGPDNATNVIITIPLPEGFEIVKIHGDGNWTCNEANRTITWTIGNVPVGDPYLYVTGRLTRAGSYVFSSFISSETYNLNTEGIIPITINAANAVNVETALNEVNAATIEMQKTGVPFTGLILAILTVFGGLLVPKRK